MNYYTLTNGKNHWRVFANSRDEARAISLAAGRVRKMENARFTRAVQAPANFVAGIASRMIGGWPVTEGWRAGQTMQPGPFDPNTAPSVS